MFCKRVFLCLLFAVLLFFPILSSASQARQSDIYVAGDETKYQLVFDEQQSTFQQNLPSLDIPMYGIDKTFIAYDSIHNRYLMVYIDRIKDSSCIVRYRVYGQLVDHLGELLGEPFEVSAGGYLCPNYAYWDKLRAEVAFDRVNRHFLVVWPDFRTGKAEIFGQFIAWDGSLIGAGEGVENNFRISSNALGAPVTDLAFDPLKKRFLVVWSNYNGNYCCFLEDADICARFIDSSTPLAPLSGSEEFIVAPSSTEQQAPAVAFDSRNRHFLVVWHDRVETHSYIKGQLLDVDGKRIGSDIGGFEISDESHDGLWSKSGQPEVAWGSFGNRFLVAWTELFEGNFSSYFPRIHGQIVNPNGTLFYPAGQKGNIVIANNTRYQRPAYNTNPNIVFDQSKRNFLVVYTNQRPQYGQYVSPEGILVGTSFDENFYIGGEGLYSNTNKPGLAYNSRCGHTMVCWSEVLRVGLNTVGSSWCTNLPVVKTGEIDSITGASATCNGRVELDGGLDVTVRGFCWGTKPNPGLHGNHIRVGKGLGHFEGIINGLSFNTTYYVRAFAISSGGTGFGIERTFTTPAVFNLTFSSKGNGTLKGELSQTVQFGNSTSPVLATANNGSFFIGWTGDEGFVSSTDNPLIVSNVTSNMNIVAHFSPIRLQGERITSRGNALKHDIGELDISCDAIDATLPLVFKLYRSIDGAGRKLISEFSSADMADGRHRLIDTRLDRGTRYHYEVEVLNHKGENVGKSAVMIL